ncbi:hypothetical protein [Neotabrizicola shimadae]|uniref:Uncharacterized protein n=1 Tax=Neotabrizicola shimadae TaxID=2807096 RepID=A0A8G0ZYX1_9RHOB|nr:hypothetical protein [Neotabrizicola shimadae]QYZ71601.1 hypothetical protein JO391_08950 [Neotabrizicola shimadae]
MRVPFGLPLVLALVPSLPAFAAPPALTCQADVVCIAGGDCNALGVEVELDPEGAGYRATLDAGADVLLSPLGSATGGIVHFNAVSEDGVAVILSIYVDGRFAMTVQQDLNGPNVETTFGNCKPRS